MNPTVAELAKMIDHSLLHPTMTTQVLDEGLAVALEWDVASVCIKPYALPRAVAALAGSSVAPSTVIGFPHGGETTADKLAQIREALASGATELDGVVNIGQVLADEWGYVRDEVGQLAAACHEDGALFKLIFENCYLDDAQKIALCELASAVGVDFVKTSTGYGTGGATLDDLRLMRAHTPPSVRVKAAGGVRTLDALLEVRAAGASRCGATRTVEMLSEAVERFGR